MDIKLIIWDWNGTLLNDVQYCRKTINLILKKYNLPLISLDMYREYFTFPVKNYYKKIGFDFNKTPFEKIGLEFIEKYNKKLHNCKLQNYCKEILLYLKNKRIKQIIISARKKNELLKDLKKFRISDFFDFIEGIDNNYAGSKEHLFENYLKNCDIKRKNILLIGDTIHDCQIAEKMKINFILFENGHQSNVHFKNCENLKKINSLAQIKELF